MDPLTWMADDLTALRESAQLRRLTPATLQPGGRVLVDGRSLLNLSGNDYLGLAGDGVLGPLGGPSGAGGSRLMCGDDPVFGEVERAVAALKGCEAALVFGSGYLANVGVIPALVGRGDAVYSDRLNHASIIDGIRLSGAELCRYRHSDPEHLRELLSKGAHYRRRLIVSDALFSMDGDYAPLAALVALRDEFGAMLMLDEAHSGGVCGPAGAGYAHALGLAAGVDVQMGTFSKAYGSYGAYVAGRQILVDHLLNHARSFIFTTAVPPVVARACWQALSIVAADEWRRERLRENVATWRAALAAQGVATVSTSAIQPLVVGAAPTALAAAAELREAGLFGVAIRPPTVPPGTARLRFSLSAAHAPDDLRAAAVVVGQVLRRRSDA